MDIVDTDFQGDLKFQDSYVDQATALPNATDYTSDSFDFGQVQSALSLNIKANGAVVIANAATLKIELYDSADDTTFALATTLLDYTNSSGVSVTFADGANLCDSFVASRDIKKFCKIKITTTTDLSAYDYDAYLSYIVR